jgi:hypothetical protein
MRSIHAFPPGASWLIAPQMKLASTARLFGVMFQAKVRAVKANCRDR